MTGKSFSSLPPIGGGINGAIPKGVIAPSLSGVPSFTPYTGAPFYCSVDESEIADYWFKTPLGWLWGGWECCEAIKKINAVFSDRDRIICPPDFNPNHLLRNKQ
jgi:hypothetical protein